MIQKLEPEKCLELLRNNYIGHLAFIDGGTPYVVPITYYYRDQNGDSIICYSLEGHKIDAMRKKGLVALLVEEIESMVRWKSV